MHPPRDFLDSAQTDSPSQHGGVALLHNMGCRPQTTIRHTGLDRCHRLQFVLHVAPGAVGRFLNKKLYGRSGFTIMPHDDWKTLTKAVLRPCPELALLPDVAAVAAYDTFGTILPGIGDNPRVVLAVLARCAGGVFLRDRSPHISLNQIKRSVTLIAPHNWRPPS